MAPPDADNQYVPRHCDPHVLSRPSSAALSRLLPGAHEARIAIDRLEIISGHLPRRALALVFEWADLHREELQANWASAEQRKPLSGIEPLE